MSWLHSVGRVVGRSVGRTVWPVALAALVAACGSDEPQTPLDKAEAAFAEENYAEAALRYEQVLLQQPENWSIIARLGRSLYKTRAKGGERGARGERLLERAIAGAQQAGDARAAVTAQRYLARVRFEHGDFEDATALYTQVVDWSEAAGESRGVITGLIGLAGVHLAQHRFEEAHHTYFRAYGLAVAAHELSLRAYAEEGLGIVMTSIGDVVEATNLLRQSITTQLELGHQHAARKAMLNLASHLAWSGDWRAAQQQLVLLMAHDAAQAAALDERGLAPPVNDSLVQEAAIWVRIYRSHAMSLPAAERGALVDKAIESAERGMRALEAGGHERWRSIMTASYVEQLVAIGQLESAQAQIDNYAQFAAAQPDDWAVYMQVLGAQIMAQQDRPKAARKLLQEATTKIEGDRSLMEYGSNQNFFFLERIRAYHALAMLELEAGNTVAALAAIGKVKARALSEHIMRSRGTSFTGKGGLKQQFELKGLQLQEGIDAAAPATVEATQALLPSDLAVIEYFVLDEQLLIFWIERDRIVVKRRNIPAVELERMAKAWFDGIRRHDRAATGQSLSEALLDPIAGELGRTQIKRLCIVPHGPLHQVPFVALPWGEALLIDRASVFSSPSLPALHGLLSRPPSTTKGPALVIADSTRNLPGARREATAVAALFPHSKLLLGSDNLESRVLSLLPEADIIHFAVHGVTEDAGGTAHLQLVKDARADGALRATEVARVTLKNAPLVVLSVCDSAQGTPNQGDEIVGVVDRAFLKAGARSVVASRWPVHDGASERFMSVFYAGLSEGMSSLDAFYRAERALRKQGPVHGGVLRGVDPDTDASNDFSDPYYWAAFSLKGDPR